MSGLVEKVARAIWDRRYPQKAWESANPWFQEACTKDARTALEACLEPTPGMIAAGIDADDQRTGGQTCVHIFQAMLRSELESPIE